MKILFVTEHRGFFGGVEQCVADSSTGLSARGHACHLAHRAHTGRNEEDFDTGFASVTKIQNDEHLSALVADLKPAVVYVHKAASIQPVLAAARDIPVVQMVHDHDLVCPRRHKYDRYTLRTCQRAASWKCVLDLAFVERAPGSVLGLKPVNLFRWWDELRHNRGVPRVVVASRYMRQELLRNGFDPAQVRVLAPCVKVAAPPERPPPRDARLLYVGQLVTGKGVDLLLRALARLAPEYHLDLVGSGNAEPHLRDLARKLRLEERVTFHGWVPAGRVGLYFQRARIVVVPSRWPEPFGMVGVEAMGHARPVVAFDVGGISDWLLSGTTGRLVPEQDVAALAAAIDGIHREPGMAAEMGRAGRERYQREYRYESLLDRLEAELADASAGGARVSREVSA